MVLRFLRKKEKKKKKKIVCDKRKVSISLLKFLPTFAYEIQKD